MTRLTIYHDDLETPIGFPYMHRKDITTEMIMARFLFKKDCIVKIRNDDNMCALRCIVVGIAHNNYIQDKSKRNEYKQIINSNQSKKPTIESQRLAKEMNIDLNVKCSIAEIKRAEEYLKIYQMLVISSENDFEFIYAGAKKDKQIILFHHNNHFDYVRSLPAFFNDKKFCFTCLSPYHDDLSHDCIKLCKICRQKTCKKEQDSQLKCTTCKIVCSSKECLMYHQENVCKFFSKCITCGRIKTSNHTCLGRWCLNCSAPVEMNHKCFILTEDERNKRCLKRKSDENATKEKNENKTEGFIFYYRFTCT